MPRRRARPLESVRTRGISTESRSLVFWWQARQRFGRLARPQCARVRLSQRTVNARRSSIIFLTPLFCTSLLSHLPMRRTSGDRRTHTRLSSAGPYLAGCPESPRTSPARVSPRAIPHLACPPALTSLTPLLRLPSSLLPTPLFFAVSRELPVLCCRSQRFFRARVGPIRHWPGGPRLFLVFFVPQGWLTLALRDDRATSRSPRRDVRSRAVAERRRYNRWFDSPRVPGRSPSTANAVRSCAALAMAGDWPSRGGRPRVLAHARRAATKASRRGSSASSSSVDMLSFRTGRLLIP